MQDEPLVLWDGEKYDAELVGAKYPELVQYARAHDCLRDRIDAADIESRQRERPVRFRTVLMAFLLFPFAHRCGRVSDPSHEVRPKVSSSGC